MVRLRTVPVWALVLAVLLAGGFALRAHAAAHPGRFLAPDERAYARLSAELAQHAQYDIPGAAEPLRWAPGTPMLFAAARRIGGGGDRIAVHSQFWAQAIVGTATIAATFALGLLLAGPWAGVAAAAAVALYPPYWTITGDLVSEPLGALTLTLAMAALVWAWRSRRAAALAAAGFALGLALLVRADLLLIPLVAAGALLLSRRGARPAIAYLVGVALAAGPWIAVASITQHQLVPVATGGADTLYIATYLPGHGTMYGLRRALGPQYRAQNPSRRHVKDGQLRAQDLLDWVWHTRRPHRSRDAALRAETLRNLRYDAHHPGAFAEMTLDKLERLWLGYDRGSHHADRQWILRVHLTLVALGLLGLLIGLWRTRDARLAALLAVLVAATVINAFFVAEARHNARLLPLLLAAGAAGWATTAGVPARLRRREPRARGVAPTA